MIRVAISAAVCLICFAAATPALACRVETYLLWYDVPELAAGEVAIEIDMQDAIDEFEQGVTASIYKVVRVVHGSFQRDSVRVDDAPCRVLVAPGYAERVFLIGQLNYGSGNASEPLLVARPMRRGDPIQVEAERLLEIIYPEDYAADPYFAIFCASACLPARVPDDILDGFPRNDR